MKACKNDQAQWEERSTHCLLVYETPQFPLHQASSDLEVGTQNEVLTTFLSLQTTYTGLILTNKGKPAMSAGNSVHPHAWKTVRKGTSDADFGDEHTTLCGSFRRLVRRQRGVSQRFIWHLNFGIGREGIAS